MKINSAQLDNHLRQNLASIYLISGDEPLLVDEAKKAVYQAAAKREFKHREVIYIETNATVWQEFAVLAYNLSLFATKQIIELRFNHAKPGNVGSKMLIEYAEKPIANNILLLVMPKIDAATQKSKWFKALEKTAVVVPIWPLDHKQLPSWIANKAQQLGLRLNYDCANIIAERAMGNLLAAQQELEKLFLLYGSATVTVEQLLLSLSDTARLNSFDLMDAIYAQKNHEKIINILEHLKAEDSEPTLILWAITREIRLLINCKNAINNGDTMLLNKHLDGGAYKLRIERKNQVKQLVNKLSMRHLEKMLCLAGDIDQMIKGVKSENVWLNVQRLMMLFW